MSNEMNVNKIVIGAAIGGAVGCAAVYLLSSKKGKGFRNSCEGYSDKLMSLISSVSNNLSDNISETTANMTDRAGDIIESIKDEIGDFPDLSNKDFRKGLIIGGVLGGLLGSGTSLLCNGQEPSNWKSMAKNVFAMLENNGSAALKTVQKSKTGHDVLDLAAAGIQFWKNIKK